MPLSEIPDLIVEICELLAAGAILWDEYGEDGQGPKMISSARGMLKDIREGNLRLVVDGAELATAGNDLPSSYFGDDDEGYTYDRNDL
jgi:hypothetical protein